MDTKLKNIINSIKKIPLSNNQIINNLNHTGVFYTYPELNNYNNIDELFKNTKSILLLYLQSPIWGHWCCLNKLGNNLIEFFDPYGIMIDYEFKFNDKTTNKKLGQIKPKLSELMLKSKYKLSYNEFAFQELNENINTCGRHCLIRMNNINLSLIEYKNIFDKYKKILNPDDIVSILTYDV